MIPLALLVPASVAQAKTYSNCYLLTADFPYGVAQGYYRVGTSQAKIDRKTYLSNKKLDFDKDGLVCEVENLQNPPTTTTPKTPLSDLEGFVANYGKSVVTVSCPPNTVPFSSGSGVSVLVSQSAEELSMGIKSTIVTTYAIVQNCLSGAWTSRVVGITVAGVTYVGYVWSWKTPLKDGKDIAVLKTTGVIPPVSSLFDVTRPQVGDAVIAISQPIYERRTAAQLAIAGISDTEILTTAQAGGHKFWGGTLFNKSGQMIGLIQNPGDFYFSAIPVTLFCNSVYGTSGTCANGNPWK